MHRITNNISEPIFIPVQSISDDRGYLVPFTDEIDNDLFHRCYIVENYGRHVIRGLHYHKIEMKIFTVVRGAGKFITAKLDADMAERANHEEIAAYLKDRPENVETFVISSRHHGVLVIPPFYANGWISLEDHSVLVALSNARFEVAREDDIQLDPYIIDKSYWQVIGR